MSTPPEPADGDYNRAGELDALAWTWSILAGIIVSMRIYSRLRLTHNMWWDDYAIILTVVCLRPSLRQLERSVYQRSLRASLASHGSIHHLLDRPRRHFWLSSPLLSYTATSDVRFPFELDHPACRHYGSRFWEDFRCSPHLTYHG